MLAGLFGAGDEEDAKVEGNVAAEGVVGSSASEAGPGSGVPAAQTGPFNFWNVAAAVSNTVKARADELLKGVAQTDWKSELMAFSKEVSDDTATLKAKAEELVEQLPEALGQDLPSQADLVTSAVSGFPGPPAFKARSAGSSSATAGAAPGGRISDGGSELVHNLEDVGGSITRFGKSLLLGTKELLEQVRDAVESEIAVATKETKRGARSSGRVAAAKLAAVQQQKKYSRFESEVSAMQRDSSTYCDEPEDAADYAAWRAGTSLDSMADEIKRTVTSASFMAELQERIVPGIVQHEDFWLRYFYRYHKLQAKEEARQQLAARAKSLQAADEVDVGWGDDDEEEAAADLDLEDLTAPAVDEDALHNDAELSAADGTLPDIAEESAGQDATASAETDEAAEQESAASTAAAASSRSHPADDAAGLVPAAGAAPNSNAVAPAALQETAATTSTPASATISPSASEPHPNATSSPPSAQAASSRSREGSAGSAGSSLVGSSLVGRGGSTSPSPEHIEGLDPEGVAVETASDSSSNGGGKGEWCVVGSPSVAAAVAAATDAALKAGLSPASVAAAGAAAASTLSAASGRRSGSGVTSNVAPPAATVDSGPTTPTKASKSVTLQPSTSAAASPVQLSGASASAKSAAPAVAVPPTSFASPAATSPTASSPSLTTAAAASASPAAAKPAATAAAVKESTAAGKPAVPKPAVGKVPAANSDDELEEAWGDWD